jgi:hypothetical protein
MVDFVSIDKEVLIHKKYCIVLNLHILGTNICKLLSLNYIIIIIITDFHFATMLTFVQGFAGQKHTLFKLTPIEVF